ncbi:hypothetical protein BDP55DRAFT_629560 [Colletotrichum godetiae]|uniref:Uncharacterized protein n=1 Tax=Colletotrichum godetiae TaxID=1209918 RepID=A0AAJ0EYA4_9PEZI|nr:uncharacterized protein BDP55DRAFT_629560 [Colletotrichum godetiae]KAK1688451.1 hypothetical protein BDP55DRAFT_629560 [Colletotrichum godetiae]
MVSHLPCPPPPPPSLSLSLSLKTPGPQPALPRFTSTGRLASAAGATCQLQPSALLPSQPSEGQGSCTVPQLGRRLRDPQGPETVVPGSAQGAAGVVTQEARSLHAVVVQGRVPQQIPCFAVEGVERMVPVESWSRRRLAPTAAAGSCYRWR